MIEFEFDPGKSQRNRDKHGIDFVQAQALWNDPDLLQIPSAVITYRNDKVRLISVRRSRVEEVQLYES